MQDAVSVCRCRYRGRTGLLSLEFGVVLPGELCVAHRGKRMNLGTASMLATELYGWSISYTCVNTGPRRIHSIAPALT